MNAFIRQVVCPGAMMLGIVGAAQAEATTSDLFREIKPQRVTPESVDPVPFFVAHTNQDGVPPMLNARRIRMQPVRHTNQDKVERKIPLEPDVIRPNAIDPFPVTPWLDSTGALPLRSLSNPFGLGGGDVDDVLAPSFGVPGGDAVEDLGGAMALPMLFSPTAHDDDVATASATIGVTASGATFSVVPAPGVLPLLGLAGWAGRRRRRRH